MAGAEQRIDKWLFFARIAKSRSLAQRMVQSGAVRINREKTANAAKLVRPGDVLTVSLGGGSVKVVKIVLPGERRGPATEAATLYEDMTPPAEPAEKTPPGAAPTPDQPGYTPSDRPPDKRGRRALDRLRWNDGG